MTEAAAIMVQATAVAIDGRAVVLIGPPGCGKSDLALRLIERGAVLIGDDAVMLEAASGRVMASTPESGPGGLHVAGIGRVDVAQSSDAVPVTIVIDLCPAPAAAARFGEPGGHALLPGMVVPRIGMRSFEPSTPAKVALAVERWGH